MSEITAKIKHAWVSYFMNPVWLFQVLWHGRHSVRGKAAYEKLWR